MKEVSAETVDVTRCYRTQKHFILPELHTMQFYEASLIINHLICTSNAAPQNENNTHVPTLTHTLAATVLLNTNSFSFHIHIMTCQAGKFSDA